MIVCILYNVGTEGTADVQVLQPDAMTVNVVNTNKPTIVNQNNPTIKVVGKDDPFNATNPEELKFRMQCLSQEQLQEKLVTVDEQQLKVYLNLLSANECQNLLIALGDQGQRYVTTKRGNRTFLNILEDKIAQDKKRKADKLAWENAYAKNELEGQKKARWRLVGVLAVYIGALLC